MPNVIVGLHRNHAAKEEEQRKEGSTERGVVRTLQAGPSNYSMPCPAAWRLKFTLAAPTRKGCTSTDIIEKYTW